LIDNDNKQIGKMAVFLADISHCAILLVSILAIFLGFLRVQKLKFHGEDQSVLGDALLRFAAIGMFAYSTFNIVAGILSVHTDPKNLLIMAVGGISIIQVMLQLLFITDAQRRRIHSNDHNSSKPGRQVVTFLLICNITMWIIFTFEVQKVKDSPVQLRFFEWRPKPINNSAHQPPTKPTTISEHADGSHRRGRALAAPRQFQPAHQTAGSP